MQKASAIATTAALTTPDQMQKQFDYKDLNIGKGKIKIWIGLSKYWAKSKNQTWLATNTTNAGVAQNEEDYFAGIAGTVNLT